MAAGMMHKFFHAIFLRGEVSPRVSALCAFTSPLPLAFFLAALFPLTAQSINAEDAVGLTLKGVFAVYGYPDEVYAARGMEEWQDDVVFVYKDKKLDLYIYRDRVWQVCVTTALGVKTGDRKAAAALTLIDAEDKGSYLLYRYSNTVWPKYARFNIDPQGRVGTIYVYRPDN